MLTVYDEVGQLFHSLMAGACGYLLKRTPSDKLLEAITEARLGGAPMTRKIARKVVQYFHQLGAVSPESAHLPSASRKLWRSWRKAFATRKSPTKWASASTPSANTCTAFTRNCTSLRAPKPC